MDKHIIGENIVQKILKNAGLQHERDVKENVDFIVNKDIGVKLSVRDRINNKVKKVTLTQKEIYDFEKSCENSQLYSYCIILLVHKNNITIFIFKLYDAKLYMNNRKTLNIKSDNICKKKVEFNGEYFEYRFNEVVKFEDVDKKSIKFNENDTYRLMRFLGIQEAEDLDKKL